MRNSIAHPMGFYERELLDGMEDTSAEVLKRYSARIVLKCSKECPVHEPKPQEDHKDRTAERPHSNEIEQHKQEGTAICSSQLLPPVSIQHRLPPSHLKGIGLGASSGFAQREHHAAQTGDCWPQGQATGSGRKAPISNRLACLRRRRHGGNVGARAPQGK